MVNQGSGRLTKGASARLASKQAVKSFSEVYARAKQERNRRYIVTDANTNESREVSRFEFAELSSRDGVTAQTSAFKEAQQTLFAGLPVEIGGMIFRIVA